jgi:NADPH2:quinone reductase
MAKTIVVSKIGGPEVMTLADVDPGKPGAGEVRLRQKAIGVNFADVHYRRGTAPPHAMASLPVPFTPGLEAAAVIEDGGPGVTGLRPGDRVGYATATLTIGAYTEARLFPADRVYKLPPGVSDVDAAALMYRGITVHGIIRTCYPVKAGETILLHAAAGGVGTIISGWAKRLGAVVIGTVSSDAKVDYARRNGCEHVIVTSREDFEKRVDDITGGRGVDVCFDGVGENVFLKSFNCIRKYGMMVSYGQASGMVAPMDIVLLQHEGHYLTKFSGSTYNADTAEYQKRASDVLKAIEDGVIERGHHVVYPLAEAARAHRDLEARRTTGSLVLVP